MSGNTDDTETFPLDLEANKPGFWPGGVTEPPAEATEQQVRDMELTGKAHVEWMRARASQAARTEAEQHERDARTQARLAADAWDRVFQIERPPDAEPPPGVRAGCTLCRRWFCCACRCAPRDVFEQSIYDNVDQLLDGTDLTPAQRVMFQRRYVRTLHKVHNAKDCSGTFFQVLQTLVQTGSILTPALLSVQHMAEQQQAELYWATWGVSLGVGLLTNYIKLFKLDQKELLLKNGYMRLKTEGWLFLTRAGKYKRTHEDDDVPLPHSAMFADFASEVERIAGRMKQAEIDMAGERREDRRRGAGSSMVALRGSPFRT